MQKGTMQIARLMAARSQLVCFLHHPMAAYAQNPHKRIRFAQVTLMTSKHFIVLTLCIALPVAWAGTSHADTLDCNNTTTEVEAAICYNTELLDLVAFADVLGSVVGLDIRYPDTDVNDDLGMSNSMRRLLSTLTLSEAEHLVNVSQPLAWDFVFDAQNNILFIKAKHEYLQDGLVVFDPSAVESARPLYTEMEYVFDAVRHRYRASGNILEIMSMARPAESTTKYRYQDGCWRLIGEDRTWAGYMIEFNDDLAAMSINHLTGQAIFDFKEDKGVLRSFDPEVRCLSDRFTYHDINYHDSDG